MADVIKSVRQYLLGKTAITDLISQRFYQGRLPQGATLPAATLSISSESYDHAISSLAGLIATRIQIDCYATTAEASRTLADAMIWCGIDEIKGTTNGTNIRSVVVEDGRREYEDDDTSGGDEQRHVTTFDLMVDFVRT